MGLLLRLCNCNQVTMSKCENNQVTGLAVSNGALLSKNEYCTYRLWLWRLRATSPECTSLPWPFYNVRSETKSVEIEIRWGSLTLDQVWCRPLPGDNVTMMWLAGKWTRENSGWSFNRWARRCMASSFIWPIWVMLRCWLARSTVNKEWGCEGGWEWAS